MSQAAVSPPRRSGVGRIRRLGAVVLVVLLLLGRAPWTERLQSAWFDLHQTLLPRPLTELPVTVVEIDARSLGAHGQWPWPRTTLAQLVDAIAASGPAAIGLDILMPEPDAQSPDRVLARMGSFDKSVTSALAALASHDAALGDTLRRTRAVLAVAGLPEPTTSNLRSAPVLVRPRNANDTVPPGVVQHRGALTSLDLLDRQAAGWGLISVDPTRGVVRRMPLVASINGTLVPAFSIELLRLTLGESTLALVTDQGSVRRVQVGSLNVATEDDASVRPWFSHRSAERFVSATDVLQFKVDAGALHDRIVIVSPTALALGDYQATPVGERMPGAEIHAQLIENLIAGTLLQRPRWAPALEAATLAALGALLIWALPRWRPARSALLTLTLLLGLTAGSVAAFRGRQWLIDSASPSLALLALFMTLLVLSLADATRQRRALERVVQAQREEAARVAGELQAARRIQLGSLPRADLLQHERRAELRALLVPAREVGGDLYDYVLLDDHRLFILVGDVSGKGLPASIFMAVSKALYKAAMLRAPDTDIGDIMAGANAELSRDNAEALFVTVFAAILDLDSGELCYCNAGHDNPWLLRGDRLPLQRLTDGDGPPLCAMEDYPYRSARTRLQAGDILCVVTDGVTEAQDTAGTLFGVDRLEAVLAAQQLKGISAHALVQSLEQGVAVFVGTAAPADDLTILVVRWNGPAA